MGVQYHEGRMRDSVSGAVFGPEEFESEKDLKVYSLDDEPIGDDQIVH